MSDKFGKEISEKNTLIYEELANNFNNCECVKYSAYRTASKLHLIQRFLWFDHISLEVINGVLTKHSIFTIDNRSELCMDELKNVLHDIYFVSLKSVCSSNYIKLEVLVNLCVKFLKSSFGDLLSVLDVKVALASLCSCSPQNKFKYWFSQLTDHNLRLSKVSLKQFLSSVITLSKYLSESETHLERAVESVLESLNLLFSLGVGLGEAEFLEWAGSRPPFLAWLPVFFRFCSSRNVAHSVKCAFCLRNPIVGLRYSCLECLSFNLCQTCFFSGKICRSHKVSHPMVEYCQPAGSCAAASEYVKTLVKKWCPHKKSRIAPVGATPTNCENAEEQLKELNQSLGELENSLVPSDRLSDIIREMEDEAKKSEGTHQATFLLNQVRRLREVRRCLTVPAASTPLTFVNSSSNAAPIAYLTSTPHLPAAPHKPSSSPPPSPLQLHGTSDFSSWLRESVVQEPTHLQADVDKILLKINKMLETSFWTYD